MGSAKSNLTIEELMKVDAGDESLRKYKEALLGAPDPTAPPDDPNDPRTVVLEQFVVEIEDRPPLVFDLTSPENREALAKTPFTLKEKCIYNFRIRFKVQHNLVAGLKWMNSVYKGPVKVFIQDEMIGSYAPGKVHEWTSQQFENPSGWVFRSSYKAVQKFVDDDKVTHLKLNYCFNITKDWPNSHSAGDDPSGSRCTTPTSEPARKNSRAPTPTTPISEHARRNSRPHVSSSGTPTSERARRNSRTTSW
eukprot:NODE_537_length_1310_cov_329.818398_g389_i0.p1 GENE.NODE_537_length_1310_cov_329.818398_g389_i0~~NODE_537_length_1310_cov_329.818398_g389_i0.p1  ORF type:complete len:257 (+),score=21.76 NODE_537_length_1310_cov_329.818398_g389_i0:23-772(+)